MKIFAIPLCICMAVLGCLAPNKAQTCEKKGIGFVPVPSMTPAQLFKIMNAHWYYDWVSHPVKDSGGVPFVPMFRGKSAEVETDLKIFSEGGVVPILLGFNEPDLKGDTAMTPDEGVALWQKLQRFALRLGSPAASTYHPDWLERFMTEASQRGLKVEFIAFHYYGPPDAHKFLTLIDDLIRKYHRPIWVTEFAILNPQWRTNPDLYSPADALKFMQTVLPELERRPEVERFAWWGIGGPDPERFRASRFFNVDGSMTDLGRYYAQFEADAHDEVCGVPR